MVPSLSIEPADENSTPRGALPSSGVAFATLLMTVLLVIFSEVLPKSWAISSPDRFAMVVAPVVRLFVVVVGPLSSGVNALVRGLLSLVGINLSSEGSMLSAHEELRSALDHLHREGGFKKADRDRVGGLLDLEELEVSDVMKHRTVMRAVNADDPPEVAVRAVLEAQDAATIEAATEALAKGTEPFAAQRMNRGIRDALAGKSVQSF